MHVGAGQQWLQAFRTTAGSIYLSTSADGATWEPAVPSSLPNPNSKVRLLHSLLHENLLSVSQAWGRA